MAQGSHKRETNARFRPRPGALAAGIAVLATAGVVGTGVTIASPESSVANLSATVTPSVDPTATRDDDTISRGGNVRYDRQLSQDIARHKKVAAAKKEKQAEAKRLKETAKAVAGADEKLWTEEDLNLWTLPGDEAVQVGEIESGEKVLITGRELLGREEVVIDGKSRWVTAGHLADEKPVEGIGGDCTNGTSVPAGVSPNIAKVHQAVCARFPEITTYGTFRSDGEHGQGLAVDIMVSGERGWEVAEFVRANASALGVNYAIYSQKIWSVQRSGEGWRGMSDRGSTTANHYDHVHVTTY